MYGSSSFFERRTESSRCDGVIDELYSCIAIKLVVRILFSFLGACES